MNAIKSVGFTVGLPGSDEGFTTCVFYGKDVPVGTEVFIVNQEELEAALRKAFSLGKLCGYSHACGEDDSKEIQGFSKLIKDLCK